jgi:outer membrane murein-binding lipoprotein Lpp
METASLDTSGAYAELTTLLENSPAVDGWYITVKVCKIASLTTAMLADVADCFTKQTVAGFSLSMLNSPLMAAAGALEIISESFQIVVETKEGELSEASYKCIVQIGIEHTEMATDLTNISGNLIQIQADVNSVGGGVDVLALQLEATDAKVDYLVTKTDTIDLKVDTLTQKVDALSLQVAEMNRQMNEQFETMTALLNQRFNSVETLLNTPHGLRPNFPKK